MCIYIYIYSCITIFQIVTKFMIVYTCVNIHIYIYIFIIIEGSLGVKLPTIWTDGKAQPGRSSAMEKIRREKFMRRRSEIYLAGSQKKEDAGAR